MLISVHHALLINTCIVESIGSSEVFVTSTCWQISDLQGQQMAFQEKLQVANLEASQLQEQLFEVCSSVLVAAELCVGRS